MESLEQITEKAACLDEKSRAQLASQMLRSLPTPLEPVSDEEVKERIEDSKINPDSMLSQEQFVAGIERARD